MLILPNKKFLDCKAIGQEKLAQLVGNWQIDLIGPDGKIKLRRERRNLIVNTGFQFISDAAFAQSGRPAIMQYIGVGSGATAAAAGQTTLVTEILPRVAMSYAYASKVATLSATFAPGVGTGALTESAIFTAATAGIMLNRVTFSVVNKGAADTVAVTFTLTLA